MSDCLLSVMVFLVHCVEAPVDCETPQVDYYVLHRDHGAKENVKYEKFKIIITSRVPGWRKVSEKFAGGNLFGFVLGVCTKIRNVSSKLLLKKPAQHLTNNAMNMRTTIPTNIQPHQFSFS